MKHVEYEEENEEGGRVGGVGGRDWRGPIIIISFQFVSAPW
jgi:hypothetical protein